MSVRVREVRASAYLRAYVCVRECAYMQERKFVRVHVYDLISPLLLAPFKSLGLFITKRSS